MTVTKVVLRFDRAFWRDAGLSHVMLYPADPDLPTTWVFDHDAFDGQPVLAVHVFPGVAGRVLDGSSDEAVSWALSLLAEVGKTYQGRVVNMTKFGAFVNIGAEREGLVHILSLIHISEPTRPY